MTPEFVLRWAEVVRLVVEEDADLTDAIEQAFPLPD